MTRHYPDLGSTSDWSCRVGNLFQPIRSTTQNWVVTRHQYGISALVSQTSFGGKTSGSVAKCRLFSQASYLLNRGKCSLSYGDGRGESFDCILTLLSPVSTYQFSRPFSIHFLKEFLRTFVSFFLVHVRCQQWSAGCDGFNVGRRVHEACTYLGTTP